MLSTSLAIPDRIKRTDTSLLALNFTSGRYRVPKYRTNKVLVWNANPVDLSFTQFTNATNGLATFAVVDDIAELTLAGLQGICTSGRVWRLNNTAGDTAAYAFVEGVTGNTSNHAASVFARITSGTGRLEHSAVGSSPPAEFSGSTYRRYVAATPISPNSGSKIQIRVNAGANVYFILPQLEEGSTATPPIVTEGRATTVAGSGGAFTHAINLIPNSSMAGATSNSLPTGWAFQGATGFTNAVVGAGIEDGRRYIDWRLSGTNSSGSAGFPALFMTPSGGSAIPATANTTYTVSSVIRVVAGATAVAGAQIGLNTFTGATNYNNTASSLALAITSTAKTFTHTPTVNASTAYVQPVIIQQVGIGETVDVTLRIYAPQLELGSTATPYIATTTTARGMVTPTPGQNMLARSQEIDNAVWAKSAMTAAADQTLAPDGTLTADLLTSTGAFANAYPTSAITVTPSTPYTFSVYAKASSGSVASLVIEGANSVSGNFNLTNGTCGQATSGFPNVGAEIIPLADGWYRCVLKFTTPASGVNSTSIQPKLWIGMYSGTPTTGQAHFFWGAQLELGSHANTYIPTTSAASGWVYPQGHPYGAVRWNLNPWSNAINSGVNGYGGSMVATVNGATAPDGTQTASLVTTSQWVFQEATTSNNGTFTFSLWLKAAAGTSFTTSLGVRDRGTSTGRAGQVVTVTDQWQRFSVTGTTLGASPGVRTELSNGYGGVNVPAGTMIWGWQIEMASAVSDLILTYGTPAWAQLSANDNSKAFISDFSQGAGVWVARTSGKYAQTAAGTLQWFGNNVAAITDKGLLSESASTNYVTQSQDLATAASGTWTKFGVSVLAAQGVAPDGTNTANRLTADASNTTHFASTGGSVATAGAGTTYTGSIYAKAGTTPLVQLAFTSNCFNVNDSHAIFNLTAGQVVQVGTGFTATISPLANGWYRCTLTGASDKAGNGTALAVALPSDATPWRIPSWAAAGTESVLVWGAQCELGAGVSSYIPTTTATATRAADDVQVRNTYVSAPFVLVVSVEHVGDGITFAGIVQLDDGGSNTRAYIYRNNGASQPIAFQTRVASSVVAGFNISAPGGNKVALRHRPTTASATGGGVNVVNTAAVATPIPPLTRLLIGQGDSATRGYIKSVAIYSDLTDAQLLGVAA